MKTAFTAILAVFLTHNVSFAQGNAPANVWVPQVQCAKTQMEVDGLKSTGPGFLNYQVVIRDPNAVTHLRGESMNLLPVNAKGEIVLSLETKAFDGSFLAQLGKIPPSIPTPGYVETLQGKWLNNGKYEVDLMRMSVLPGQPDQAATQVGQWVFAQCVTAANVN